jgi:hypothetical protein
MTALVLMKSLGNEQAVVLVELTTEATGNRSRATGEEMAVTGRCPRGEAEKRAKEA